MANDDQGVLLKYRNPVMHDRNPPNYFGKYQITDQALKNYGKTRETFGSTTIIMGENSSFNVKDYMYVLENGKSVGMTFIPINDTGAVTGSDGKKVFGSVLVDELLREKMYLKPDDPIYAIIYYIHPEKELTEGTIASLSKTEKIQMGITHWGSYLGNGRTSNSPPLYHNRVWRVTGEVNTDYGYPANLMILSMKGVDQAVLNKNLTLADNFLNYGVRFPKDYKNSKFRAISINTALMFYRDWVLEDEYLKQDKTWFTYCAAHKTIVANIGLNLPHNEAAFREVYGAGEGSTFWNAFCTNYYELTGYEFADEDQTDFEPLWKKHGLTSEQIKPLTKAEYDAYDAARRTGELPHFKGPQPLPPNVGTPWGPQMTADIIYDFVQAYADFIDAGAIATCATVYGFCGPAAERTDISQIEYLVGAIPVVQHAMEAHATIYAAAEKTKSWIDSPYYRETFTGLYKALGGTDAKVDPLKDPTAASALVKLNLLQVTGLVAAAQSLASNWEPLLLTWFSMMRIRQNWSVIMKGGQIPIDDAYVNFMDAIQEELEKARDMLVSSPKGIQYNAPPAEAHMIGIGMFCANEYVKLQTIATVMDHSELELAVSG